MQTLIFFGKVIYIVKRIAFIALWLICVQIDWRKRLVYSSFGIFLDIEVLRDDTLLWVRFISDAFMMVIQLAMSFSCAGYKLNA